MAFQRVSKGCLYSKDIAIARVHSRDELQSHIPLVSRDIVCLGINRLVVAVRWLVVFWWSWLVFGWLSEWCHRGLRCYAIWNYNHNKLNKLNKLGPIDRVYDVSYQVTNNRNAYRPKGPQEVVLTGTFDSWSGSLPLVQTSKGDFEITLPLKQEQQQDDKVEFKFIVDGNWTTSENYETVDDNGNQNNVLYLKNLQQVESKGSKIPEAGGLTAGLGAVGAAGAAALGLSSKDSKDTKDTKDSKDVNTTVLPSQEGKQTSHKGEPGIAIPQNPHEISAFNEVRDVDAKQLNKDLNAKEDAKAEDLSKKEVKTTVLPSNEGNHANVAGEPGVAIPSDPHQIKEFNEVRNVDAKALNAKLNAEENDENDSKALKTQVEPSQESKHANVAGEPGIAVPTNNGKDIEEFTQVRDVDAKELNSKLDSEEGTAGTTTDEKKTKIVKVKKLIRRNKKTGEETVISSTPIEDRSTNNGATTKDDVQKTLDPKKSISDDKKDVKDVKDTTGGVSTITKDSTAAATTSKDTTTTTNKTTGTNGSKPKSSKPTTNSSTTTGSKEEKKPSLFRKVKKFFD